MCPNHLTIKYNYQYFKKKTTKKTQQKLKNKKAYWCYHNYKTTHMYNICPQTLVQNLFHYFHSSVEQTDTWCMTALSDEMIEPDNRQSMYIYIYDYDINCRLQVRLEKNFCSEQGVTMQ